MFQILSIFVFSHLIIIASTHQATFGFDKRTVGSVHFIVKTTSITEIMSVSISSPQRSGSGPTVNTLPALWKQRNINILVKQPETSMLFISV